MCLVPNNLMKYAHLADLHLGSWREPKMKELSLKSFNNALDKCVELNVDFILFSGDLFDTALPSLDLLKEVTKKIKEVNDKGIRFYVIAGSHDFSPSGKTMLDVLENAGLIVNVCKGQIIEDQLNLKFTLDQPTGAKITGMVGKMGMLDKQYYLNLNKENLENEKGYKIFMFHTTLSELKPEHLQKIDSQPLSLLPQHFNYYAGGHIHHQTLKNIEGYGPITYPGALFPNNFAEMEKYGRGGFYLIDDNNIEWINLNSFQQIGFIVDCHHKDSSEIEQECLNINNDVTNKIVTLRFKGKLNNSKLSDINFKMIQDHFYDLGAYFVMRNTSELNSPEFDEIKLNRKGKDNIEEEIIKEHLQQNTYFDKETELNLIKNLLNSLNTEKMEGETVNDFKERVSSELDKLLNLTS
jgi:DNA repair protein SbcD/Mre11